MTRVIALLSLVSVSAAFPVQASAQTDPTELTIVTVEGQQSVPTVNIDGDRDRKDSGRVGYDVDWEVPASW